MRLIPAALKAHLEQPVTTTCRLLKIRLKDGREFGLTSLDQAITYDGVEYSAINGFNPTVIASDSTFAVDNAEMVGLLSADIPGITAEMVLRGELDDATWQMLLINYEDTTMGHAIYDEGDLGEVRVAKQDTVYIPELLSYAMRLRQSIGHVDSRKCRAIFGTPANSQLGCGVDVSGMWLNGTVDTLGVDPYHSFGDSTLSTAEVLFPGRIEWLTGDNVSSRLYALEEATNSPVNVSTFERMPFPVQMGDTFRIRPDCDKTRDTCRDRWGNLINMKGEPDIPVADGTAAQTPGATV